MSQSERIRYIVTGYNFTEISRGKGSIEYQLSDDFGNERSVTAMAKLNIFNKISSIKPIYHRELPLVEALSKTKLNQSVIVDFSEYNKQHPRGSMRKQKISVPSVSLNQSSMGVIDSLGSLFDNKMRLLKLVGLSVIFFVFISFIMSQFA